VALIDVTYNYGDRDHPLSYHIGEPEFGEDITLNFEILTSLGLIRFAHEIFVPKAKHEIRAVYFYISQLGIALLKHCVPNMFVMAEAEAGQDGGSPVSMH
jgi:hypothetical protein